MSGNSLFISNLFPLVLSLSKDSSRCFRQPFERHSYPCRIRYLCVAAATGTTYSGYFVAGAPCTIV